ncbi:hypothetical protein [Variovorax sp. 38R]|uniref:portal protein n=1 Tax=Variovorax sp. 38R TaxID=2774875 RepID=UPI00177BB3A9|nr:hypothetical protein [Variovorax sp. 38R]QOF76075.1 hypothetical protein IG196_16825 [Variovorax sp. 38R]
MTATDTTTQNSTDEFEAEGALTLEEYKDFIYEIEQQPHWRVVADKELDYADGNQLDTELLAAQRELGIPPAKEDLIGPALLSIQGYEANVRTDWRVTPNGQPDGQDIADALNFRLNEAERHSKADRSCSAAFRPQAAVGLGWVEVSRDSDPFKYPYRCTAVHRNEIHWDFYALEDDLSDARYLRRTRWLHPSRLVKVFPQHKDLIRECGRHGQSWWLNYSPEALDGGSSTGLSTGAWDAARSWTVAEHHWYDPVSKDVCLAELWYRRWVDAVVLRAPDGRVVEYDEKNPMHNYSLARGLVRPQRSVVARVRRSFWLGPHCLHDGPSPYTHRHFPYVPFWGFREDSTRVPYGLVRGMIFQQDRLNSGTAAMTWGMTAYRVERTGGVVDMTDEQLRRQVGRRNADIKLNAAAMMQPGARFEVKRDVQLTDQQLQMLADARMALERVSPAAAGAFSGRRGTATSGVQEETQVEQANQSLAHLMDNFRAARTQVGELLMSMIVEDMGREPHTVVVEGDAVTPDRVIHINKPEMDPATGAPYLSNDLQRMRLKVGLEDVPSTATYRGQQLRAMSEAVKSLPPQFQAAAMPFLASLMDVPFKRDLVEALRAAGQQESPEQIEQRVNEAVQQALAKAGNELKARELDMKEARNDAEIKKIMAQAVQIGVQAAFSAMQGGAQVATMPMVAPIADNIMQGAGYKRPNPGGDDPNFPTPVQTAVMSIKDPYIQGQGPAMAAEEEASAAAPVRENTSPMFPARSANGGTGMNGIETTRVTDNVA